MSRRIERAPRAAAPVPEGFTWRGLAFAAPPPGSLCGLYKSAVTEFDDRSADWRCEPSGEGWHARLRVGGERYPGVGATREAALDAAAAEAETTVALIVSMLPPAPTPEPAPRKQRPRTSKGGK